MKITEGKKKTNVVLQDKEEISITALDGNIKVIVKCLNNTLHIDEKTKEDLPVEDEEEKAIQAMKDYLKKQKKGK